MELFAKCGDLGCLNESNIRRRNEAFIQYIKLLKRAMLEIINETQGLCKLFLVTRRLKTKKTIT